MARSTEQHNGGFNPNSAIANSDALKASRAMPADQAKTPQSQDHTVGKVVLVATSALALGAIACGEISTIAQTPQTPGTGPDSGGGNPATPEPTATPDTRAQTLANIQYIAQLYQKDPTFKENDPYGWADSLRQLKNSSNQLEEIESSPNSAVRSMDMGVEADLIGFIDNEPVVIFYHNNQPYIAVLDFGGSVQVVDSNKWNINTTDQIDPATTVNLSDLQKMYSPQTLIRFGLYGPATPADGQKAHTNGVDGKYIYWLTNNGSQPANVYNINDFANFVASGSESAGIPATCITRYDQPNA